MLSRTLLALVVLSTCAFAGFIVKAADNPAPPRDDGPAAAEALAKLEGPFPTLRSDEPKTVAAGEANRNVEGVGGCGVFRYGAVSTGPITVTARFEKPGGMVLVTDGAWQTLGRVARGEGVAPTSLTLNAAAGDEFRIIAVTAPQGEGASIEITVTEKNIAAGEKKVRDAVATAMEMITRSKTAQETGDLDEARRLIGEAFSALESVPGCRQREKAVGIYRDLGEKALELHDLLTSFKALRVAEDFFTVTLPLDGYDMFILWTRLYIIYGELGDYHGAQEMVDKKLTHCRDHLSPILLEMNRLSQVEICQALGDFDRALSIGETSLARLEELLPPGHLAVEVARITVASTLQKIGDFALARSLTERGLEVFERELPGDAEEIRVCRSQLSAILFDLGELEEARELIEKVHDSAVRLLPPSHPGLQESRLKLGTVLFALKEYGRARALLEKAVKGYEEACDADHPDLLGARTNLALAMRNLGECEPALAIQEDVFEAFRRILPQDHPDVTMSRWNLAETLLLLGRRDEAVTMTCGAMKSAAEALSGRVRTGAVREIDEICGGYRSVLDRYLSLGRDGAIPAGECFRAAELFRSAGYRAGLQRRLIASQCGEQVEDLQREIVRMQSQIAFSTGDRLAAAVSKRDRAERELARLTDSLPGSDKILAAGDPAAIAAAVPEEWICVSYMAYTLSERPGEGGTALTDVSSYLAFLLDRTGRLDRIDLGPAAPIDEAATLWRQALCGTGGMAARRDEAREEGARLKKLIWDPLRTRLGRAKKVIVAPDSVLATIPLEALPDGEGRLVEKFTFAYVDSLSSLAIPRPAPGAESAGLVALGGVDYDEEPETYTAPGEQRKETGPGEPSSLALAGYRPACRSGGDDPVDPLPGTKAEVRAIGELFRGHFGEEPVLVEGSLASKDSLVTLAPRARYLHIATHGFFVPENIRSANEQGGGSDAALGAGQRNPAVGLAPSLLCGLRLAGCNRTNEESAGKGVITAEEIQGLDLTRCRLAVLSACDSNVGLVRAGSGIMSLQRALGIAGARGSVTSLWKVDDEATRVFFEEFYRRLWKEGLAPAEALHRVKIDMLHGRIRPGGKGTERGPREPGRLPRRPDDYSSPFYWANFVYWGKTE